MLREFHLQHMDDNVTLIHNRISCIFTLAEIVTFIGKSVDLDDKGAIDSFYEILLDCQQNTKIIAEMSSLDKELFIKAFSRLFLQKK